MNTLEIHKIDGQFDVRLVKLPQGEHGYAVIYGHQVTKFGNGGAELFKAVDEFNDCVMHQMGCAGWTDDL